MHSSVITALSVATLMVVLGEVCLAGGIANKVTMPYKYGVRIQPFSSLPSPLFNYVDGATISIEFGYSVGYDRLLVDYEGAFDIKSFFNKENGVLYLSGQATLSEYNAALASVVFVTTADDGRTRKITWAYGNNTFFFSLPQHYYRFFPKRGISWEDARNVCNGTKYFGMTGYLATVTSADEMNEIGRKATYTVWLGGSDAATEGTWRWVTGPEGLENGGNGQIFWTGASMYAGGSSPPNTFAGWNRFQPDNGGGTGEDYLQLVNTLDPEISFYADSTMTNSVDGFICEYGGLDAQQIYDTMPLYSGSVQLYLECANFSTSGGLPSPQECLNHADFGCSWNSGVCQQTTCAQYLTDADCSTKWMCEWNVDGNMGTCVNTPCSAYATEAMCLLDLNCAVQRVAGLAQCRRRVCSDHTTSCGCNTLQGCSWRGGKCGYSPAVDCNGMDVVFLLDGSTTMAQQFGRYGQGFRALTNVLGDAEFVLTGTTAGTPLSNRPGGPAPFGQRVGFVQYGSRTLVSPPGTAGNPTTNGRLTGSLAEVAADLAWHQKQFSPWATGRTISDALKQAIIMFGAADATRTRVLVIFAAGTIDDAIGINRQQTSSPQTSLLATLVKNKVTITGVALRPTAPDTPDSLAAAASLPLLTAATTTANPDAAGETMVVPSMLRLMVGDVASQVVYGMCGKSPMAPMVRPSPPPSLLCASYTTRLACTSNPLCTFDDASVTCQNSACLTSCSCGASNPMCMPSNASCVQSCGSYDVSTCSGVCVFNFDLNICQNSPCIGNPTEDGCIADPNACLYNYYKRIKCNVNPCGFQDPTMCTQNGCVWNGKECYENQCMYGTQSNCSLLHQCMWTNSTTPTPSSPSPPSPASSSSSNGACTLNLCGVYQNERDCQGDWKCQWDVSDPGPGVCGPAPCTYYNGNAETAKSKCLAAPTTCLWQTREQNGLTDMCVRKTCDLLKTSCECSTLSSCVWRNEQCKDNRFVQCPAIDVVFLVEGTRTMLDDFGRHPNGYIGVVESIRKWSKDAPFAATPASTGFRMALVTYGASRLALGVPPGIGGGGNLTGDPNQWLGIDQELDWNENQITNYATTGDSNSVAIKAGLQKALQIFTQSSSHPDRKRLVVILGTSAITDGDNNLVADIANLEGLNVQIFANVLRRFSYITPGDVGAAAFMTPLASDPYSTHFLFTTVDEMKATLLEKFCDPSTGTGQVLQVSRDRELPCSWLSGKTECDLQGSCSWNNNTVFTCPQAGQCPNMGCVTLPEALVKVGFKCRHCTYTQGAFQCSLATVNPAPTAACVRASCMFNCESECGASSSSSSAAGQCTFANASQRCERRMCQYTSLETCNADLACVWQMSQDLTAASIGSGVCIPSVCGRLRSLSSCNEFVVTEVIRGGSPQLFNPCKMLVDLAPPICEQMRCPQMDAMACLAFSISTAGAPAQCTKKRGGVDRLCSDKTCFYASSDLCNADSSCFWNPFTLLCSRRSPNCVLSGYSEWAPCTANCGPTAVTFKTRTILQHPAPSSSSATCAEVAALGCDDGTDFPVGNCLRLPSDPSQPATYQDQDMTIIESCSTPPATWLPTFPGFPSTWSTSCTTYCQNKLSKLDCAADNSCYWIGDRCTVKPFMGCIVMNEAACTLSDMCKWDTHLLTCTAKMDVCPYTTQAACQNVLNCNWRTGAASNALATQLGIPIQLFNPGQPEIYPFATLSIDSTDMIHGATVVIEGSYQRGKDLLTLVFGNNIRSQWNEQAGTLRLFNNGTVSEYARAIRFVSFTTTSTRASPRRISWSFGNNTVYAAVTGHHYRARTQVGASYNFAKTFCASMSLYGLAGYLATVTSSEENDMVSTKALGVGWISGDDSSKGLWRYSTGPEMNQPFWNGPSASLGGSPVGSAYSNWAPSNATNVNGEPIINIGVGGSTGNDRPYLARSGYWESRPFDSQLVDGFICEFGGSANDFAPPYPIGGAMTVGIAGCIPTPCIWHNSQAACGMDIECQWVSGICQSGCASRGTESDCASSVACRWDTAVVPPACDINRCAPLGVMACGADPQCEWDPVAECKYRTGCGRFGNANSCEAVATCMWSANSGSCGARPCESYTTFRQCRGNQQCSWDTKSSQCSTVFCTAGTEAACLADTGGRCMWSSPDVVSVGFQPGGATMLPFATGVEAPADITTLIDGITIAITEGFQQGMDMLYVDPADNIQQNFLVSNNPATGVLMLMVNPGVQVNALSGFNFIQKYLKFSSESTNSVRRKISFTLGANMIYSPDTKSYFQFRPVAVSSFATATSMCASSAFFGLPGRLAIVANEGDNLLLKKLHATGWISAGSDSNADWSWLPPPQSSNAGGGGDGGSSSGTTVVSPTSPVLFWKGRGAFGVPVVLPGNATAGPQRMYAQWDIGEPAVAPAYGYLTGNGMWRALVDGTVPAPMGVICQYGSPSRRSLVAASGVRNVVPQGCFVAPCLSLLEAPCRNSPSCVWRVGPSGGVCARDTSCMWGISPSSCSVLELCYWDYTIGLCRSAAPNACSVRTTMATCATNNSKCEWNRGILPRASGRGLGACVYQGCRIFPAQSTCLSDPMCQWIPGLAGPCAPRLCGYQTPDTCWRDNSCVWKVTATDEGCAPSPCTSIRGASECAATDSCRWNATLSTCLYARCSTKLGKLVCQSDAACLYPVGGPCVQPDCNFIMEDTCNSAQQCYFSISQKKCLTAQCVSNIDLASCEQGQTMTARKPCIWDAARSKCRQPTYAEQHAPPPTPGSCQKEATPNLWWLWSFLAVILLLVGIIIHRLYLAHAKGFSFFEATRKNYKYSPHQQYAQELLIDARNQQNGAERNTMMMSDGPAKS